MISSRLIGLSVLSLSLVIVLAGCGKQPAPPVVPAFPPSAAPAPAPETSTAPEAPAPAASSAPAPAPSANAPASASSSAEGGKNKAMLALANKSGCLACHSIDKKIVGPAWKDVAAKYRGQAGAEAKLVKKVEGGGSGVWGQVPMPPNSPRVSDANIKKLVDWILTLK